MPKTWTTHQFDLTAPSDYQDTPDAPDMRQWLLTNGTGAYAMGCASGLMAHRYHGLFVAAVQPPVGRVLALNQMLETICYQVDGQEKKLELTTCAFLDPQGQTVYAPQGHTCLTQFTKGLSASWTYQHAQITFKRSLFLHYKQQAITLSYEITGLQGQTASLLLEPLLTLRDFHSLHHADDSKPLQIMPKDNAVTFQRGDIAITLACHSQTLAQAFTPKQKPSSWYQVYYPVDNQRGQEDREDYDQPGQFEVTLPTEQEKHVMTLTVGLGDEPVEPLASTQARQAHLSPIANQLVFSKVCDKKGDGSLFEQTKTPVPFFYPKGTCLPNANDLAKMLAIASDDFVVDRTINEEDLSTVLAGYPWFADWGRDTFIALPGLLLATQRHDEARSVLRVFAQAIKNGLIPNRFDDYDDQAAHYNTVDASLWFVVSAIEYVHKTGDMGAWSGWLAASVTDVIEAYIKGTDYAIAMTGDGLISAGNAQTQLTWMDAACNGKVFTPRLGKAVEINALWYHVLVATSLLMADQNQQVAQHYKRLAQRTKRAFIKVFWDPEKNFLRDHVYVDEQGDLHMDPSLRPNQIFAACFEHSPLPRTKQHQVIRVVKENLLTPMGLATLPPEDANYQGQYAGEQMLRDQAYHQGTVWPWLIGPYAKAVLHAGQFKAQSLEHARQVIEPLLLFMANQGVGQLFEIHEANHPHAPVGCMAQAWSVAQIIDVLQLLEQHET